MTAPTLELLHDDERAAVNGAIHMAASDDLRTRVRAYLYLASLLTAAASRGAERLGLSNRHIVEARYQTAHALSALRCGRQRASIAKAT